MDSKGQGADTLIGIGLGIIFVIWWLFSESIYLALIIPASILIFIVYTSGSDNRDDYHKSKKALMLSIAIVAGVVGGLYGSNESDFDWFFMSQDFYVLLALGCFVISCLIFVYYKKLMPVSFLEEDDRLVQQTMYRDYDYIGLKDRFAYRGVEFKDKKFNKFVPDDLNKVKGDFKSTELDINDLEVVATDEEGNLKFYYEKLVYDFYNDFMFNQSKRAKYLLKTYGYNLTIIHNLKSMGQFKKALRNESMMYWHILRYLELDIKKVKMKINFKNIYEDNFHCLELTLISIVQIVRYYSNFPVGDLAKYIETKKDKNFIGCFGSLPTDYKNVKSTTIAPPGLAYYFLFYKLHLEWFNDNTEDTILDRWAS